MTRVSLVAAALLASTASAAKSKATMHPCSDLVSFDITADGGANFEARVRVARWQPDRTVELDFGSNDVHVRAESVSGSATLIMAADSTPAAHQNPTFRLDALPKQRQSSAALAAPPGVFTFRADGLPSQPRVLCNLEAALTAFSPSPPPPPPQCTASLLFRNGRKWNGGFEAFVEVGGAGGVPAGFAIRIDFGRAAGSTFELLAATGGALISMESPSVMLLRPELQTGNGQITLRVRGGGSGGGGSPQLKCVVAPPAPPPPPSPCALGVAWDTGSSAQEALKDDRQSGTVTLSQWVVGITVTLDFGEGYRVLSASSAVTLLAPDADSAGSVATVRLTERGKRTFKVVYEASSEGNGVASKPATPYISCSFIAPPSPPRPPPYPPWPQMAPLSDCALGVVLFVPKAFAKSYSVDIGLHGWVDRTLMLLHWDESEGPGAPAAADVTACYGCEVVAASSSTTVLALRTQGSHGLPSHYHGIGYRVEGASATRAVGATPSQPSRITCDAVMPPPPAPPPPPWCGLRPHYHLLKRQDDDRGRNGRESPLFEAEVVFDVWEVRASELEIQLLRFGPPF